MSNPQIRLAVQAAVVFIKEYKNFRHEKPVNTLLQNL